MKASLLGLLISASVNAQSQKPSETGNPILDALVNAERTGHSFDSALYDANKQVSLTYQFVKDVVPSGRVGILKDVSTSASLGSVVRVCPESLGLDPNRAWFVSGAHVPNGRKEVMLSAEEKLKVEAASECGDLTLLSSSRKSSSLSGCFPLAPFMRLPLAYSVDGFASSTFARGMMIEGADREGQSVKAVLTSSPVVLSPEKGISGRECVDQQIRAGSNGYKGQSGGAWIVWRDPQGYILSPKTLYKGFVKDAKGNIRAPLGDAELGGIVLSFDEGRQVNILPSTRIIDLVHSYQAGRLAEFKDPEQRRAVPGGTLFMSSGLFLKRARITLAGSGGGSDGGSGGGSDGSSGLNGNRQVWPAAHASFADIEDQKKAYWSLGHGDWCEYEAPTPEIAKLALNPSAPSVYQTREGNVYVCGGVDALPDFIDPKAPGYSVSSLEPGCLKGYALQKDEQGNFQELNFKACQKRSSSGMDFRIEFAPPIPDLKQRLDKDLISSGRQWGLPPLLTKPFLISWRIQSPAPDDPKGCQKLQIQSQPNLEHHGLRDYIAPDIKINIARRGGITFEFISHKQDLYTAPSSIVSGPVILQGHRQGPLLTSKPVVVLLQPKTKPNIKK